jgi:2-polyprenyl-3-methyl-5-hydroxy-6-metoxy-1,4-benzoquinol methylase
MYQHIRSSQNDEFRDFWVTNTLRKVKNSLHGETLLDVGAGLSPYKMHAVSLGFKYLSHDFGKYVPDASKKYPGLHSVSWSYPHHDFQCDILDIPDSISVDVVVCTEVLEHVPDPIRVFDKLSKSVKPGGYLIFTVPFSSLMHQAPYWFQAGLSPFWFEYWAAEFKVEIVELTVYGDYIDQMSYEISRLFPFLRHIPYAVSSIKLLAKIYRRFMNDEVLSSGGFGVLFLGKKY